MSSPIVQVKQGQLKGRVVKNIDGGEYFSFSGVPYAEPPIGDLRFREPRRTRSWSKIRDADKVSMKAAQYELVMGIQSGDEDCLYLNISTNSLTRKQPVMVWIHGGGFVMGGPNDLAGPDYLIKHDVVIVGVTYRLGCFGFLNLDMPEAPGNQGLKDQIAALRWIKENIEVFGGDSENITLFGTSAGSVCVHMLTLSPLTEGLYHKVITQSGVCHNPWAFQNEPVQMALRLSSLAGKKTDVPKEAWEFLMSRTTNQLIEAQRKMNTGNMAYDLFFNFTPSIDRSTLSPVLPEHPRVLVKRGIDLPLLMGYTSDEGIVITLGPHIEDAFIEINSHFAKVLARDLNIPDIGRVEKIADTVRQYYFGEGAITQRTKKKEYAKLKGDIKFINGIQEVADLQMEKSTPTYLYRFSYIADHPTMCSIMKSSLRGACHGDECGALFYSQLMSRNKPYTKGTRDRFITDRMTRLWTNFAKTGDPTPDSDEDIKYKWKSLTKDEKNYLDINDAMKTGINPDEATWNFWKNILENL